MYELIKDCQWVFKIIISCNKIEQVRTAKNCVKQLKIKWSNKIDTNDLKLVKFYNDYINILIKQVNKFEMRYGK